MIVNNTEKKKSEKSIESEFSSAFDLYCSDII